MKKIKDSTDNSTNDKSKESIDKNIKHKKNSVKNGGKKSYWTIKITIITFFLSIFFSFISEITSSNSSVIVAILLLLFLVIISIIFDGIGVAATSCDLAPLLSMASRKVPGSKMAVILVKNAEKVSNICADVIGDICGIVSGACSVAIVLKLMSSDDPKVLFANIIVSAIIAAMTVGGKAFVKQIAINNSKELIMFAGKIISFFYRKEK